MKSHATRKFWEAHRRLPRDIQRLAFKQYRLWLQDPFHPSTRFKKVGAHWSARVSEDYRAVGIMDGDTVIWYFIGAHSEYDRLLKSK